MTKPGATMKTAAHGTDLRVLSPNESVEVKGPTKKTRETIAMQHTFDTPLIALIRDSRGFLKVVTAIKLFFFLSTFYFIPGAQAVEQAVEAEQAKNQFHPQGRSDEEKLSNTLQAIKEHVAERKAHLSKRVGEESGLWEDFLNLFGASGLSAEDLDRLQFMVEAAEQLHQKNLAGFADIEQDLKAKGLPEAILQRHADTVNQYQEQYRQFREKLGRALQAESLQDQDNALGELDEFLDEQQFKRRQQPLDPDNLPFSTPDPDETREPVTDPQALDQLLGLNRQPGTLESIVDGMISPAYAQTGNQPTPADLEPTVDVQITEAIQQKALELNNDPVEIYNWVRNSVEFIPTYGSIQGADYTLETFRGNAFDTSSLLIALLRASNIPARYAYGTVSVPVDKVMNWVGGVEVPAAAQQLLGQGGIPNVALVSGGQVTHIQMEHVWVQAWLDFEPSRGARNIEGDSWVSLDASFKQYEYGEGFDFQGDVPFDGAALVDAIRAQATVDDAAGSLQGAPHDVIAGMYEDYQSQLAAYIDGQGDDLLAEQVLGSKKFIISEVNQFSAGLPYDVTAITQSFSEIPGNLRHKIRFTLQRGSSGGLLGTSFFTEVLTRELNLPEVAGKTLSLSYTPATEADNEVFLSFIPGEDEPVTDSSTNLPAYLMNVAAELSLDKETLVTAGSMPMGTQTNHVMALYRPSAGWSSTEAEGVAGEYRAIGIDVGTISPALLDRLAADAQAVIDRQDQGDLTGLGKHDLAGPLMQGTILNYFAFNDVIRHAQGGTFGVVTYRLPSYGYFFTTLTPSYFFGIPRNTQTSGVTMDVPFLSSISFSRNNDQESWVNYNRATGAMASYLENWIPEISLSTEGDQFEGVSAIKLLVLAQQNGQKVFRLTRENASQLANIQIDADARREIANALNAGKEVTVHEAPFEVNGWSGSGYLIIDPATGAGAYLISGGANGGSLIDIALGFLSWVLGMIDGGYGHWSEDRIGRAIFSDKLKNAQRLLKISKFFGYIGLLLGIVTPFLSRGLTWEAAGIALINVLAFFLTVWVVSLIALATGIVGGFILGGLAAIAIAVLASALSSAIFD